MILQAGQTIRKSSIMRVGIIGTGAIAGKHAQAYRNIGYRLVACTDRTAERGQRFANVNGGQFVPRRKNSSSALTLIFLMCAPFPVIGWPRLSSARSIKSTCWCKSDGG